MATAEVKAGYALRQLDQRIASDADQAEFAAYRLKSCPLDEGVRDERIADAMDDFGSGADQIAPWAADDGRNDDAVGALATEVQRRSDMMGGAYPFKVEGNALYYRPARTLVYELCLAMVHAPSLSQKDFKELPVSFERVCKEVAKCYLGDGAEAYRTGWPVGGESGRSAKFKSVATEMNRRTTEWVWRPAPGMPEDPSHKDEKDLGIDFTVWKNVGDGRRGMLFLLGQCACGDDWDSKFKDLDPDRYNSYFQYLSVARPVHVFCVPHHIRNAGYFDVVNRRAGLTFDRARIAMLAEKACADIIKREDAQSLIDTVMNAPNIRRRERKKGKK